MSRIGDWVQTFSGVAFYPFDPRPDEVRIVDIAHSLALQCRFAGHCSTHYSVAEHSVHVMRLFEERHPNAHPSLILGALLHDAAEAYLVDIPRPLKRNLGFAAYRETELMLQDCIVRSFGIEPSTMDSQSVHICDNILLATEARDLMARPPMPWAEMPEPLAKRIEPLNWRIAERAFMDAFLSVAAALAQDAVLSVAAALADSLRKAGPQ